MSTVNSERNKQSGLTLFQSPLTKGDLFDLVEEERRRSTTALFAICSPVVATNVLMHYMHVIGSLCDAEIRASVLVTQSDTIGERAALKVGDGQSTLGLSKFVRQRTIDLREHLQQLVDEENHFGCDSLTAEQEMTKTRLERCAENLSIYEIVLDVMNGAEQLILDDRETKETLQSLFFLVLTYSSTLREVACCRKNSFRMPAHFANQPSSLLTNFFCMLPTLTNRYVRFDLDESQYMRHVRWLLRTGSMQIPPTHNPTK